MPFEMVLRAFGDGTLQGYYVVIGLGDEKYDAEYVIESAALLEEFVVSHGGTLLMDSLRIHQNPIDQLDGVVTERAERLAMHCKKIM